MRLAQLGASLVRRLFGGGAKVSAQEVAVKAEQGAMSAVERELAGSMARDQLVLQGERALRGKVLRTAPKQVGLEGGHVPKELKLDQQGKKWMVKGFMYDTEFRSVGDKVGSDVVRALGVPSPAVHLREVTLNGKRQLGTVQKMVPHSGQRLPWDPHQLTKQQIDQLTESQVARWLIADHDGKVANFLVKEAGDVVTIDLGNMYRHFPGDRLSKSYVPNWEEPVYNRIWQAYTKGTLAVDFRPGMRMVERIEKMQDAEFIRLIRPYVEALYLGGKEIPKELPTADSFLRAALERKRNIRRDVTAFYDQMARERGVKGGVAEALQKALAG